MLPAFDNQRILLIRLGSFGDLIFTLPAVHLVRKSFPAARITFLVYKEYASLLEGFAGIDAVMTLDRERYRCLNPMSIGAETVSLLSHLARNRFRLVVDFQGFGETGVLTRLSCAPHRWGIVYKPARKWAYTHPVWRNNELHPVAYNLELLRQAGGVVTDRICNEFVPSQRTMEEARHFFANHKLQLDHVTLFIQPFTSDRNKTWPLEKYLATAQHWRNCGVQILFGGGPADRPALEPVRQAGFAVAAGASPLLSAGLVKLSSLVLGGDTGLMHLAVALNKRVIMLMSSTHAGACIPFGHPEWAIAPPNGSAVHSIAADVVKRACDEALLELRSTDRASA